MRQLVRALAMERVRGQTNDTPGAPEPAQAHAAMHMRANARMGRNVRAQRARHQRTVGLCFAQAASKAAAAAPYVSCPLARIEI